MIVKLSKRGTSFKGAAAYYLHDKKRDGELSRSSDERVAWTATRNITTKNAAFAFRVMAATAMDKDRLKEQAGISTSGRKTKGDVYSYCVAWHPDEQGKISKADMLVAVDETLKTLGATNHQAVIIAHSDEPHPHAHVIVNLVNPDTGKNLALYNDLKKLDKWAYQYRKIRGEEEKYCPNRDKKAKAIEAKKNGLEAEYIKGENVPRELYEEFEELRAMAVNDNDISSLQKTQAQLDQELVARSQLVKKQQKEEKQLLDTGYQDKKRALHQEFKAKKAMAENAIKAQMKPAFAELYRQQGNEKRMFDDREKRLSGKLTNAIDIVKRIHTVWGEEDKGFLSMAFGYFARQGRRSAWIQRRHNKQVQELRVEQNRQIKKALSDIQKTFEMRLASYRATFIIDHDALTQRHKIESNELRSDWTLRKKQKKLAIDALKRKGQIKSEDGRHLVNADIKSAKQDYVATRLEQKKTERESRKGRRSRKRKRD